LEIKPNYPDAMGNMGVLFFSKQDYKTALSWYEKALIIDPNFRDAYFNMGVTWYYLNDRKKSRENFGKAAALGHAGAQQWIQNNP
jgi:Tfp pilus assembly protein PilF